MLGSAVVLIVGVLVGEVVVAVIDAPMLASEDPLAEVASPLMLPWVLALVLVAVAAFVASSKAGLSTTQPGSAARASARSRGEGRTLGLLPPVAGLSTRVSWRRPRTLGAAQGISTTKPRFSTLDAGTIWSRSAAEGVE